LLASARVSTGKLDVSAEAKYKKLLRDATIFVWEDGGSGADGIRITDGVDGIKKYINNGAKFHTGVSVSPLEFKMRYVKDPHPITYLEKIPEAERNHIIRVKDGMICRHKGGGRDFYGNIDAQAFDSEGHPNKSDKEKKPVWTRIRDKKIELKNENIWVTTGCARQEFSWGKNLSEVKRTAYIEFTGWVKEHDKYGSDDERNTDPTRVYLDKGFPRTVSMIFRGKLGKAAPMEFKCTLEAFSE
jgi:hypothetical protein